MSEISSRPRVRNIERAHSSGIESALAALLVAGAASLIVETRRAFRRYSRAIPPVQVNTVEPLPVLAERRIAIEQNLVHELQATTTLPATEALKVSTFVSLRGTPYVVSTSTLAQPLRALARAHSLDEVHEARRVLLRQLEVSHREVLQQSLGLACKNVSIRIGFTSVQVLAGLKDGLRVIATDARGRSLVSEISPGDSHSHPSLATEVIGVTDGSCVTVLDAFDKGLEEEGVRSTAPVRKHTGGVCELAAAREFVRRKLLPQLRCSESQAKVNTLLDIARTNATRRAQRLNDPVRIRQK